MKILYHTGRRLTRIVFGLLCRPDITGVENIPKEGGYILASNHISNFDPPIVGSWVPREVSFLAKKELFPNKLAASLFYRLNCIPVKRGVIDRKAIEDSVAAIEDGRIVTIFPEGTRFIDGELHPPKPGVGVVARKSGCAVIPAYLHGTNRLKDCIRGRVKMSINYGPPIPADWIKSVPDDKEGYIEIAEKIMAEIAKIRDRVTGR